MSALFHSQALKGPKRRANLEAWVAKHPKRFPDPEAAARWLHQILVPASGRWAYYGSGKSGTSSTKRFLFQLEFGVPLSTHLTAYDDMNPDVVAHMLAAADVFRTLSDVPDSPTVLENALRVTTVRNPYARAVSSFRYLCQSDEMRHPWFSRERIRMNAAVGFDWDTDPQTLRGFTKFLDYVALDIELRGVDTVNPHWRPQFANIRPRIFNPHLIGKVEEMERFYRDIAERLGQNLPEELAAPHANRASSKVSEPLLDEVTAARIERVYEQDFSDFDYDMQWRGFA